MTALPPTLAAFLAVCLTFAPSPAEASLQDEPPPASASEPDKEPDATHFPRLESIRALADSGEMEQARTKLRDLIGKKGSSTASLVDEDSAVDWLTALASLAGDLSDLEAKGQAREELYVLLTEILPADDPDLLIAKLNLSTIRRQLGDLTGALELAEHVHTAWERLLPSDHPNLLHAKGNLANTRYGLRDLRGALELYEHVHAAREQLLPADHPDLLLSKQNLAATRLQLGDLVGAHELFEHVHAVRERLLPADHPNLLAAKLNLANTCKALGDLSGALKLQEHVHAAWKRLLPTDHPDLLLAKQNLANTRMELGDLAGALELQELIHAARERRLPADHPDLLTAKENLAGTRRLLGDLAGALELVEHVHSARERMLPADHPDLLSAKLNLATIRRALGDLHGALELVEHVHSAQKRRLLADHPDLLSAKLGLAAIRKALGDLSGALELFEHVHRAQERLLPADHPNLLGIKLYLANTRKALGDLSGALELGEHVHAAWERLLPADHPDLLAAKGSLAATRYELGDFSGAHELFEHAHAAQERLLPADHPDLLIAKLNLANTTRKALGDFSGALGLQEHVHAVWERLLPANHPELLTAKGNLAVTRAEFGDLSGARELLEHVHAARERLLPADHADLLRAKGNLALNYGMLGDAPGALELSRAINRSSALQLRRQGAVSRRQARELAALVSRRVAETRVWSEAPDEIASPIDATLECLELARSFASGAGSPAPVVSRSMDPETARLTAALQEAMDAIDSHVARPPEISAAGDEADEEARRAAAQAAIDTWSREVARLSLVREERERELFARLEEQGEGLLDLTPAAIAAALIPAERAVGIHKLPCWRLEPVVDPPEGSLQKYEHLPDGEHYIAYAIDHDGSTREIDLGSAEAINDAVLAWRDALGSPLEGRGGGLRPRRKAGGDELSAGRALRRLLVDPLSAGLEPGATLYVCLDDALHALPVDALPLDTAEGAVDGAPARLGDLYTIHPELSFARLIRAAQESDAETDETANGSKNSLLIVGDVRYDKASSGEGTLDTDALDARILAQAAEDRASAWGEWSALSGTKSEAIAIDAVARRALGIEPATLDPINVTRKTLSGAAAGKRYVHIATHGWFMPKSVRSMFDTDDSNARTRLLGTEDTVSGFAPLSLCGLVMSGANTAGTPAELSARLLTAMELSAFDLSSCELAVLSACETNVGVSRAGQGIQSLRTALHQAGARTSVTSLWRVDDAATRDLMVAFYENVLEKGMGKAEALWAAKGMLRERGEPVRNWAGWVLTGDPD